MTTAPRVAQMKEKTLRRKAAMQQKVWDLAAAEHPMALIKKVSQVKMIVRKAVVMSQMLTQTKTQTMTVNKTLKVKKNPRKKLRRKRRTQQTTQRLPTTKL